VIFEKCAKLNSPRRLVQFWHIFQISLVVLIINCTPSRVITYTNYIILTHPDNLPCGRKPEHPEKTHDFRQSVDRFSSHESVARMAKPRSQRWKALVLTTAHRSSRMEQRVTWTWKLLMFLNIVTALSY
jgi:hypothetical protein